MGRSLKIALTLALSRKRERGYGVRSTASFFSPLPLAGEGRVRAVSNRPAGAHP